MKRVILESPYAGKDPSIAIAKIQRGRNIIYARLCVMDCIQRLEAPIASHLLYTQPGILRDEIEADRNRGIEAGLVWRSVAEASVVYIDLGITTGMQYGMKLADDAGIPVFKRNLDQHKFEKLCRGLYDDQVVW